VLAWGAIAPMHLPGQAVGEIRGTVTDPTGAVIPSAKVIAEQVGTQSTRSTLTSNAGTYSIPALPVGTYALQVEASGFKNGASEVKLDVSQQREVNFTLALSGTSTEVQVGATAELLNTTNSTRRPRHRRSGFGATAKWPRHYRTCLFAAGGGAGD